MGTEVQGLLKFVSNGMPALMMERVSAMVAELEALGVVPVVTVTVELASTSRSSSSPISAETGMSGRGVAGMSTSPDPMPRSAEERSGIDGGERGGVVSDVSMSAGEDFLGGARGEGRGAEEGSRDNPPYVLPEAAVRVLTVDEVDEVDGVDGRSSVVLERAIRWGELSEEAWDAFSTLAKGETTWRKVPKAVRLELVQAVLAQPTESGEPMTTVQFDRVKPAWMSKAGNLTTMFECSWPELRTLRLSE